MGDIHLEGLSCQTNGFYTPVKLISIIRSKSLSYKDRNRFGLVLLAKFADKYGNGAVLSGIFADSPAGQAMR